MAMLVLGGARSGKSAHAEGLVEAAAAVTYVATARLDLGDREWGERIAAHQARRPAHWSTVEVPAPADVATLLAEAPPGRTLLVDDLATWLTTLLDDAGAWTGGSLDQVTRERDRLVAAVAGCRARLVLVSAEVGLGVVPSTASGRLFRDQLGVLNAAVAERCAEVVLLVAGIPLRLRG
jgi:adenosylcobinamide kinase / adenosylcobinamide-phosphate guanylyltransferase